MDLHGIINVSPDSAMASSIVETPTAAIARAEELLGAGCTALDLGGQASTDWGELVDVETEWNRLRDPLDALVRLGCDISVDSWKPEVMRRALDAGATMMNASDGLQKPEMLALAAEYQCPVIVSFLNGPDPKHLRPIDGDPMDAILGFFETRVSECEASGVTNLLIDPGLGFFPLGTTWPDRYALQLEVYQQLPKLRQFGKPLYVNLPLFDEVEDRALLEILVSANLDVGRTHFPDRIRQWEKGF